MKPPIKNFSAFDYPKGNVVNWFGDDVELYKVVPGLTGGHNGIDIVAPWGTPIFAVEGGTVTSVKQDPSGYGRHIQITTPDGTQWIYGHLERIDVSLGQQIEEGTQIALMGNTGHVVSGPTPFWSFNPYAGTHLHLGKRPPNPDYSNGTFGEIDFREELEKSDPNMEIFRFKLLTLISLLNQAVQLLKVALERKE